MVNVGPPRFPLPYPMARFGGWVGDLMGRLTGEEPKINSDAVKIGYVDHYYDPQKAIRELEMPQTPVDNAIKRAINWFYEAGMLPV